MTDRSFGLFEPDALLPAQFYAAFRGGSAVRGEKRLMLAVLQDALDCFQKYAFAKDGHGRQLFTDANEWIACEDRDWYFSFENICETLEINPAYLRRGVQEWRKQVGQLGRSPQTHVPLPNPAGDSHLLACG
ncbi:MAG TPA: hypothetical protein VN812_15040 [Candidatus Acidoferrales bacterium]|nr:hypothetical protein [Candidatus Acidoferrales bacterium]